MPEHAAALRAQLHHLERSSPFWRERLAGRLDAELHELPLTTKADLRADQAAHPPFGSRLCAPRDALVRLHVTSGTTGEPVAIGLTRADHAANSATGGAAFRIAGVRPGHTIAHCLNYALYAGGIADPGGGPPSPSAEPRSTPSSERTPARRSSRSASGSRGACSSSSPRSGSTRSSAR